MARKAKDLPVHLEVKFIPVPPEREAAFRAGLLLLWQLLSEQKIESVVSNRPLRAWFVGHDGSAQLVTYG